MSNHTPGPWIERDVNAVTFYSAITTKSTREICYVSRKNGIANAKLIAAAPDMLEALQAALKQSDDNFPLFEGAVRTPECQAVYNLVQAAIEKATK